MQGTERKLIKSDNCEDTERWHVPVPEAQNEQQHKADKRSMKTLQRCYPSWQTYRKALGCR